MPSRAAAADADSDRVAATASSTDEKPASASRASVSCRRASCTPAITTRAARARAFRTPGRAAVSARATAERSTSTSSGGVAALIRSNNSGRSSWRVAVATRSASRVAPDANGCSTPSPWAARYSSEVISCVRNRCGPASENRGHT